VHLDNRHSLTAAEITAGEFLARVEIGRSKLVLVSIRAIHVSHWRVLSFGFGCIALGIFGEKSARQCEN
jgi:hypothetical protein